MMLLERGKRGGLRVIYYWFTSREVILMLFAYPKNVRDDLTAEQLRALKKIVAALRADRDEE